MESARIETYLPAKKEKTFFTGMHQRFMHIMSFTGHVLPVQAHPFLKRRIIPAGGSIQSLS